MQSIKSFFGSGDWYNYQNSFGDIIEEPFTGAWQHNISLKKDDSTANYALFSCMTLTANDISNMEFEVRKKKPKGPWLLDESKDYEYLRKLAEYPNPFQTDQDFLANWVHSLNRKGNTFCFIDWNDDNEPEGLYILDPNRVTTVVTNQGEIFYRVSSDNLIGLEQEAVFTPREIIHHRINTLFHPLEGIAPLWAANMHALSSIEQGKTSYEFYRNAARPSALLIAPADIHQDDVDALKKNYADAMSGRRNAGRMMVISGGVQYQQLSMSAEDQQLIELLKFNAEAVCACFHVPAHMILGTAPSYNNIEALQQDYFQKALQFIIEGIEKNLHRGLGLHNIEDEVYLKLNTDSLLRMDKSTRYKVNGQAIKDGWKKRNEVRLEEDLEAVEGGDIILVQAQDTTIQAIAVRDERFIAMDNNPQAVIPTTVETPVETLENDAEKVDNSEDNTQETVEEKFLRLLNEKIESITA